MSTQLAAILPGKGQDFKVQTIVKHIPEKGEVLVRNHVIATNPADWIIHSTGLSVKEWNVVIGCDFAGTIEEVGEGVTQWKKGDKVYGITFKSPFGIRKGAFQQFPITDATYIGSVPNNFSFEEAAAFVLPLITAASSLYCAAKLPLPSPKRPAITSESPIFFVNSGSSGVGSGAIQLAILNGFRVIATCSPKNFDLVKSFGASEVFDYRDSDLVEKVKKAAGKKIEYAFDATASESSSVSCVQILEGKGTLITVLLVLSAVDWKEVKVFQGAGVKILEEQSDWWWKFAKEAAEEGTLAPLKPEILGTSLEDVTKVVAFHASGQVSGFKPVIKLI